MKVNKPSDWSNKLQLANLRLLSNLRQGLTKGLRRNIVIITTLFIPIAAILLFSGQIIAEVVPKASEAKQQISHDLVLQAIAAAANGQLARLHNLIGRGVDVNSTDAEGRSLLYIAAEYNHQEIVKYLLTAGANPQQVSKQDITPIQIALNNNAKEVAIAIMRHLAKQGEMVSDGWLAMHYAAYAGVNSAIDYLIKLGNPINVTVGGVSPLYLAASQGHTPAVQKLLMHHAAVDIALEDGTTPLMVAAELGYSEIVKLLLIAKANVNKTEKHGISALMLAAQNGHSDIVRLLLFAGANAGQKLPDGFTALHLAAREAKADALQVLLNYGVDPNITAKDGATPLYLAAQMGSEAALQELLAYKAAINIADRKLHTPLHKAAQNGHLQAAKLLLRAGADVNVADINGLTPLHFAAKENHPQLAFTLIRSKANIDAVGRVNAETPLFFAASAGHVKVVKVLLTMNASVNKLSGNLTPICAASQNGHTEVVKILQDNGADINAGVCQVKPLRLSKTLQLKTIKDIVDRL